MIKASQLGIGLFVLSMASSFSASATAQMAPPPPPSYNNPPSAAMMMNPYLNPYMNPLLNPAAPQQRMSVGNNLLYLYSAQAARGGIGSGRLSNPGTSTNARKRAATIPNSASVPGGSAAQYFNNSRSGGRTGASGYFNQRGGNFQTNGN